MQCRACELRKINVTNSGDSDNMVEHLSVFHKQHDVIGITIENIESSRWNLLFKAKTCVMAKVNAEKWATSGKEASMPGR
jgi:hypothetical protein